MKISKSVLASERAPKAVGPYSQGVSVGGFVFTSGQIALNPETGALIPGGIKEQTQQALVNLTAVLNGARLTLREVIKTTVYMQDLSGFEQMNEVYGRFFQSPFPVRTTLQAAALPKGALIEIEAIAIREDFTGGSII
jgi:2-iminobutanoate/2-iminopropanoate deaminase